MKVVSLQKQVNESLVEHLEILLEKAKTGDIDSMLYVMRMRDGAFEHGNSGTSDAPGMASVMIKAALRLIGM